MNDDYKYGVYKGDRNRCDYCGSRKVSRMWSHISYFYEYHYCSFRCSCIGQRYYGLVGGIVLAIFAIMILFSFGLTLETNTIGVFMGVISLILLLLAIYGFLELKKDEEKENLNN